MFEKEEIENILRSLIGEDLIIIFKSSYTACIIKFKLYNIMFSGGFHRSNVSSAMIEDHDVSLRDENLDVSFQFEYKDIESIKKDAREVSELNLVYRDGTNVTIYKEFNF